MNQFYIFTDNIIMDIDLESFLFGVLVGAVCYLIVSSVYDKWYSSEDKYDNFQPSRLYGFKYSSYDKSFNDRKIKDPNLERGKARQALITVIPELTLLDVSKGSLSDAYLITFLEDWDKSTLVERKSFVIAFVKDAQFRNAVKSALSYQKPLTDSDKKVLISVISNLFPIDQNATVSEIKKAIELILTPDDN